jgi:hypothetical protein
VTDYVPGTEEKDPKKVIMALQLAASNISTAQGDIDTNTANIATNTANIATNTTNIATNTAAIASLNTALANLIESGTVMLFVQTAAPTGWTKATAHNDKALRIVSGAAGSGGANAFSTVMAQTAVGSTTLTLSQIPSHSHSYTKAAADGTNTVASPGATSGVAYSTVSTDSQGGGGSHNHTITMNISYVDAIIATKN